MKDIIWMYLAQNQEVSIEGFGKFKTELQATYIHPIDHSFSPADFKIAFKLDKNTQDDGFVSFAAKQLKEEQDQLRKRLKSQISTWVSELKAGKEVHFLHLGNMKLNASKVLIFNQQSDFSLADNFMGLDKFSMEKLHIPKSKETSAKMSPIATEKKSRAWIWIAASILIVGLGFGAWYFWPQIQSNSQAVEWSSTEVEPTNGSGEEITPKEHAIVTPMDTTQGNQMVDTAQVDDATNPEVSTEEPDTVAISEDEKVIDEPEPTDIEVDENVKYVLVAGCFEFEDKANEYLQILADEGYSAFRYGKTNGGLIRICFGKYSKWSEANRDYSKFVAQGKTQVWIQKIK